MAPTVSAPSPRPVPCWRPREHYLSPHAEDAPAKDTPERPFLTPRETSAMSDADTEGSANTGRSSQPQRTNSLTSSESDGPRIVVHTTSEEDEDEDYDTSPNPPLPHLLSVLGAESVTSTDVGSDYTSEGGESGQEIDLKSVTPQLMRALVKQVEEYLSDEGLTKDLFLLKHVKRHREGFVSLKLLSGYKKIKKLSRDWRVLALSLRTSLVLQLNEEGTKVRRVAPLPEALRCDTPTSRAIIAVNVPAEHASMEGLATLFGVYGPVSSLQVMRPKPGGGLPPELQPLAARVPEVSNSTCAVIEYEDVWGAARALQELDDPKMSLHVFRRARRSERKASPTPNSTPRLHSKCEFGVSAEELRSRLKGSKSRLAHLRGESSNSEGEDGSNYQRMRSWRQSPSRLTPQPTALHHRRALRTGSVSVPSSPASFRRVLHQQQQPQGVTREPRGPDGTRGFARVRT